MAYDSLDRLTGEKVFDGTNLESDVGYSYDSVGNQLTKTRSGISVNYSYQSGCNRLTSWSATSTNSFASLRSVDVSGHSSEAIGLNTNLGQRYVSSSVVTALCAVSSSTNFSASGFLLTLGTNQFIAAIGDQAGNVGYATNTAVLNVITNGTYRYNAAGCVTNIAYKGTGGYSRNLGLAWNSQYQLTAAYTNGTLAESYAFDALGRRVKTVSSGVTNFMVYDGAQVVADLNSTGGLVRTYVWGPGIDNMLAMTVYTGATAVTYFPIKDHLGTVHAIVNTNGTIVERYSFDAFGRILGVYGANDQQISTSAVGNRYLWQGREYSWKTGLYYFRARWYSPVEGRWLSNDPIGISGGLNQYVFCGDSPVNSRDPFGLCRGDTSYGGGVNTVTSVTGEIPYTPPPPPPSPCNGPVLQAPRPSRNPPLSPENVLRTGMEGLESIARRQYYPNQNFVDPFDRSTGLDGMMSSVNAAPIQVVGGGALLVAAPAMISEAGLYVGTTLGPEGIAAGMALLKGLQPGPSALGSETEIIPWAIGERIGNRLLNQ